MSGPKSYYYLIPGFVWSIVIFYLSTKPLDELGTPGLFDLGGIDKLGHFLMYCIYSLLLLIGFVKTFSFSSRRSSEFFSLGIAVLYGIIMEFLQMEFYKPRQLEVLDMIANTIGALVGVWIFRRFILNRI